MADLSSLFGAPQQGRGRRDPFGMAAPHAARFKRQIVVRELQQQGLEPGDGAPFFQYGARRLMELGDIQGMFLLNQEAQRYGAAQAAAQQQAFENQLKINTDARATRKDMRDAAKVPKRSEIKTGADLGLSDPALANAAIEVQYGENNQIVDYQVLSKGDTNVNVNTGEPQIGGQELTKATLNTLQDEVISTSENIARLSQINATFDERFLQLGTRLQEFGGRIKDFLGRATPEDKALIAEFQDFKATALDNLNATLNQLSGAAVSPQEFERISKALPNPGTGLFDGDSPTQFMAKLRRAIRDVKLARARANFILSGGGSLEDIQSGKLSINGMAKIMQDQINAWDKAGFSKDQIRIKLRDTFGDF